VNTEKTGNTEASNINVAKNNNVIEKEQQK